ncbi:DUF937 domain-containing protein [Pseudanabaena sp. FACHB-2040]|uniref:DUF937 domain-containing protein n=1 Tax=Pseudanabaena sp. FACHB-2040 TaxID=2692859 RepID=UPI001686A913|nr:DUF937 domain-containing protein [Pseudanabaena sp. FACHB-2040]MBD2258395.1 DUF937 domain-containing protein [Pseudanabaena sp. FACHB-2040]
MGLFDQVLSAINDPSRQASQDQVGQLLTTVNQLSRQSNTPPSTMNQAVSILGSFVRSSLQDTRQRQGNEAALDLVREGSRPNSNILPRLFDNGQQQQLVSALTQRTGLNSGQIMTLLPVLLPVVMRLLQSGDTTQTGPSNHNSILSAFLDTNSDGEVDMGDMLSQASRFFTR